ncbi:hypothetical protein OROHE_017029 [Orobanche hederae]
MANLNAATSDLRTTFLGVYSVLKSELLDDPAFEWTQASRQWVERFAGFVIFGREMIQGRSSITPKIHHIGPMLDYNVPGGKLNRGLSVIDSYKLLKEGKDLTEDEVFLASALGWCVECFRLIRLLLTYDRTRPVHRRTAHDRPEIIVDRLA